RSGDPATLGSVPDLLVLSVLVSGLSARGADDGEQAARKSPCKEDDRAACAAQSAAGPGSGATPGPDRASSRRAGGRGLGAAGPYDVVHRARQLGLPREAIRVVDADLGVSGSVTGQREGFESLVAEVALGQVGIILALEASRLARDNAAWYRLLDLAGVC